MKKLYLLHWLKRTAAVTMLLAMIGSPAVMQARDYEDLPTKAGSHLKNDVIYTVRDNMTIIGESTAGLTVEEGATTTIYIPAGVKLIVKGADANNIRGAFAGIQVPQKSTLILTGQGILEAQGGKIGPGQNGGNGGNGEVIDGDVDTAQGGKGGDGGAGGGGSAPGIGGNGGDGAPTNIGPTCEKKECVKNDVDGPGTNGKNAQEGQRGGNMGVVYVLGTVKVTARCGSTIVKAAEPGKNGENGQYHWSNYYTAGGGGAGGGGGSGFAAPYGIGGGGDGGQSGATGGSGGRYSSFFGYYYNHGGSGSGGQGFVSGRSMEDKRSDAKGIWGGEGGKATSHEEKKNQDGKLYAADANNLDIDGDRVPDGKQETHESLAVTMTFEANADNVTLGSQTHKLYFGIKISTGIDIPARPGYFFTGYYTQETGGSIIYDAQGKPTGVCTIQDDCTLYAQWSNTHIINETQFLKLCKEIAEGNPTDGATYYLENDLDLGQDIAMLGTIENPFMGTFDGQGHTVKLDYKVKVEDNPDNNPVALFACVKSATIKNLCTTGKIKNQSNGYTGGIIGIAQSFDMQNCMSDVKINDENCATVGGLVANVNDKPYSMKDCAFIGELSINKLPNEDSFYIGGLIGLAQCSGEIESCYVVYASKNDIKGSTGLFLDPIVNNIESSTVTVNNTYYHKVFEDKGCTTLHGSPLNQEEIQSGKLCYELNYEKTNGCWYQNIDEDSTPCLNSSHRKVFCDHKSVNEMIYHNRNYVELKAGQTFRTGYKPKADTQVYELFQFKGQEEPGEVFYTDKAYTYLYNKDQVIIEDIPSGEIITSPHYIGYKELEVKSEGRLYELSIMENGVIVHHFLPSRYHQMAGFYDIVERKFIPVNGSEAYIDTEVMPCQHEYSVYEQSDGKKGIHCYICDAIPDKQHYVYARFDGNEAIGSMGDQLLEKGDAIKPNEFYRKVYDFEGWKVYDRHGKQVGDNLYADGATLVMDDNFCDTLTFKAQWAPAFLYNGEKKRINPDNTKQIDIVDDSVNGFATAEPFTAGTISYTRTLPAGQHWGSLCLPFDITGDEKTLLFTTGSISRNANKSETITLVKAEGNKVAAGVPCMFYDNREDVSKERELQFSATNAKVATKAGVTTTDNGLTFNGTFEGEAFKCDTLKYAYYGVMGDTFYNVGTSYVVYPYHVFLSMPQPTGIKAAERYYIGFEGETLGIKEVHDAELIESVQNIHDLMGSSVKTISSPGIYIVNGKKILVK